MLSPVVKGYCGLFQVKPRQPWRQFGEKKKEKGPSTIIDRMEP